MFYTGLFKRIIPFVLTFAAGLLVASFFVSVGLPNLNLRSERKWHKCHQKRQLKIENDQLRETVRDLRKENDELRRSNGSWDAMIKDAVPPVELDEHKPPPPKRPKHPRYDASR